MKFDLLHSCLMKAVDTFFLSRKVKISATDKPWITSSLKLLNAQRQKALAKWGKTSDNYKQLRNRVQEACSKCKKRFYENKVSGLRTRISLDGGRTLKSWVAFRALVIGHLS